MRYRNPCKDNLISQQLNVHMLKYKVVERTLERKLIPRTRKIIDINNVVTVSRTPFSDHVKVEQ
jgi:hypothetical protein